MKYTIAMQLAEDNNKVWYMPKAGIIWRQDETTGRLFEREAAEKLLASGAVPLRLDCHLIIQESPRDE